VGGDSARGTGGRSGGQYYDATTDGGVGSTQDETDPTWILVPSSTPVPEELSLQTEEGALVELEIIEECH
jgi:hypothetical protein